MGRPTRDPLDNYLDGLDRDPLLTAAEEHDLAVRIQGGDAAARDTMIRSNRRLVVAVAGRFRRHPHARDDMIAEGNLALCHAADTFDPGRGWRFSTYAHHCIYMRIRRLFDIEAGRERLMPYHAIVAVHRRDTLRRTLPLELGRPPTAAEVLARLTPPQRRCLPHADAAPLRHHGVDIGRVEAPADGQGGVDVADCVAASLAALGPRERHVLARKFGLDGESRRTHEQIGLEDGHSKQRADQRIQAALRKIRRTLDGATPSAPTRS